MPPSWIKKPKTQKAIIGQTLVIDCVAGGTPAPTIRWKRLEKKNNNYDNEMITQTSNASLNKHDNFRLIVNNSRMQILPNGSLVIRNVTNSDENKYLCSGIYKRIRLMSLFITHKTEMLFLILLSPSTLLS